jgi:peptidoglycan hydrolase CwlO-like protein
MEATFNTADIIAIAGMIISFLTLAFGVIRAFKKNKQRMIEAAKKQQKRDDHVDGEIDKINGRVDEHEKDITQLNGRINKNLERIYSRLDDMPKDMVDIVDKMIKHRK